METSEEFSRRYGVAPEKPSQWVAGLGAALAKAPRRRLRAAPPGATLERCLAANSFWLIYTAANGARLALRTCFDPQGIHGVRELHNDRRSAAFRVDASLGVFTVAIDVSDDPMPLLHWTVRLAPAAKVHIEQLPRDVVALDRSYAPLASPALVYLEQAGPTAGLVWFTIPGRAPLTALYFQELGALSEYCDAAHAEPSNRVAAAWPELGLSLPLGSEALPTRTSVTISDAYLALAEAEPVGDLDVAQRFVASVAAVYRRIPKPERSFYDWPAAAEHALRDLQTPGACTRRIKGHTYLNPYVERNDKPPESMVQLAVLLPLLEYGARHKSGRAFAARLARSLPSFFDADLGTVVRWLPGQKLDASHEGGEAGPDQMDSWYLLHTLLNLARLAKAGNPDAKRMLDPSLAYAIKVAHHFKYRWPVFYRLSTLEVIRAETHPGEGGEHDVPGIYVHVMLQAHELTGDDGYLKEAEAAAKGLFGLGFKLLYQTNNAVIGAVGLLRLWRATGNRQYRDLSIICMANAVGRLWMWQGRYGSAKGYDTFMGILPLQNAPYLAAYEEHEIFATAVTYLREAEGDTDPNLELLLSEFVKYLVHRARFYYPGEIAKNALAGEHKEGKLRPDLMVPLEDIRTGWEKSGQVGQEVYGGAGSFILATYASVDRVEVPFLLHAQYPILKSDFETSATGELSVSLAGSRDIGCSIFVIARRGRLPKLTVFDVTGEGETIVKPAAARHGRVEYKVPGGGRYRVAWRERPPPRRK